MEKYVFYGKKYKYEIVLVSFVFAFIVSFFSGKSLNRTLVNALHNKTLETINKNFAHLGFGTESNHDLNALLYHEFEFYASGRKNAHYMKIQYDLKKRQDMVSISFLKFIWPKEDEMWVEIGIESDQPIEMILLRRENVKQSLNDMEHLKKFVKPANHPSFDKELVLMAETPEAGNTVFTSKFADAFQRLQHRVKVVHVTDQKCYSGYPIVIKACFLPGDT